LKHGLGEACGCFRGQIIPCLQGTLHESQAADPSPKVKLKKKNTPNASKQKGLFVQNVNFLLFLVLPMCYPDFDFLSVRDVQHVGEDECGALVELH
jgi:hypothetical protein